jgi:predicted nucleic acid-binding protein
MAITLDTAIVFAYYDRSDSWIAETDRQYAALDLGFVDLSIIAIAESLGLTRIATTDRRDFGALEKYLSLTLLA